MGCNTNMYAHIICVCHTDESEVSRNVIQAYLSGLFTHKGGSVEVLSDN